MKKKWTGERLESYIFSRDTVEHLHRYAVASEFVKGKIVLDIASGEGYGTNLLSQYASFVYGIDIDDNTIQNSKEKYKKDNVKFQQGDATKIQLEDNKVDVVVSFETIEHHDKHHEMIKEIKRVLKPDGLLIISTPDKLYYTDKRNYINKFHIKELYKKEFEDLINAYFSNNKLLSQKYSNGISIIEEEVNCDIYSGDFNNINKEEIFPYYLISLASNLEVDFDKKSIFNGTQLLLSYNEKLFRNSTTYKIGYFLLKPFKFFYKLMK